MKNIVKIRFIVFLLFISNTFLVFSQTEPIFEIKNDAGQTVFAVYPGGVKIFVDDQLKATGGGFTVGRLSTGKAAGDDIFSVNLNDVRVNIDEAAGLKATGGGFTVGRLSTGKAAGGDIFNVQPNDVKVLLDQDTGLKATGGGFTVGRLSTGKAAGGDIFNVQPNDVKVLLDQDTGLKATGGGFTVGRLSTGKATGGNHNFLTVTPDSTRVYIDSTSTSGFAVGKIGSTTGLQNFMYLKKDNYFIGHNSGKLTTGLYNLFLGYKSGMANISGTSNTFLGFQSGYSNTVGNRNVFIGENSGSSNTGGNYNTFVGTSSGVKNIDGNYSTFLGYQAGMDAVSIGFNTCVGYNSGASGADGHNRAFFGYSSGKTSTGNDNTYLGAEAGYYSDAGSNNVFIGTGAGREATGSGNVLIGRFAGYSYKGSNTLMIENSTNTSLPLIYGDFNNNHVIINGDSTANPNNRTFYANGTAGGDGAWFNDSDKRLKKDITTIPEALNKVLSLRGVNFKWKDKKRGEKQQLGFIAQEAMKIIPEVVDNSNNHFSMQYAPITAILVEAVKEQQKQIEALKEKNAALSQQVSEIDALKTEMSELKAMVKEIAGTTKESKTESAK